MIKAPKRIANIRAQLPDALMIRRSSFKWPITLAVVLLTMVSCLLVLWIVAQGTSHQWGLLTVGTIFCTLILVGVVFYLVLSIKEIQLTRRQANFIDSVTHELKSPVASIKLCLQTLDMREVSAEQQRQFHQFMLADVERLDGLIDHLLMAARIAHTEKVTSDEVVDLGSLLQACAEPVRRQYKLSEDQLQFEMQPCLARGSGSDLSIIFSNVLDNAAKYAAAEPQIRVQMTPHGSHKIVVRISDNGKGVPYELRRKIFKRFFRGGSELERTTHGTGLGLYIVKTLIRKLRGSIHVHGRGMLRGATFEVILPGEAMAVVAESSAPVPVLTGPADHDQDPDR